MSLERMLARWVEPTDGDALVALFESVGSSCFCRYFHFQGDKNEWLARCVDPERENASELRRELGSCGPTVSGVIAEEGGVIVGWMKVAPAETVTKAYEQRYYRGLPYFTRSREGVFFLGCVLVAPGRRRSGLVGALVRAAIDGARKRGAKSLEAFPRVPREAVSDEELWTIPASPLLAAGFAEVAGEAPYPVLRFDLERSA